MRVRYDRHYLSQVGKISHSNDSFLQVCRETTTHKYTQIDWFQRNLVSAASCTQRQCDYAGNQNGCGCPPPGRCRVFPDNPCHWKQKEQVEQAYGEGRAPMACPTPCENLVGVRPMRLVYALPPQYPSDERDSGIGDENRSKYRPDG